MRPLYNCAASNSARDVRVNASLEIIPEGLVVDLVVVLDLRTFDEGTELAGRAVGGGLLQVGEAALHIGAENLGDPR